MRAWERGTTSRGLGDSWPVRVVVRGVGYRPDGKEHSIFVGATDAVRPLETCYPIIQGFASVCLELVVLLGLGAANTHRDGRNGCVYPS
jgi:hypothetical protein